LPVSAIECVATADAFTSLPRKRRTALWQTMALSDVPLPLFAQEKSAPDRSGAILPAMPIQQEVLTDYATAGLSLKQHPLVVLREELSRRKIITAAELIHKNNGWVRVAGLVLVRQRPGTASGVVFITLEDETGVANLIVRPDIFARHPQARTACLLQADGRVERQGKVLHLLVQKLCDLSHLLSENLFQSRDFH
jgi:error-prone DNA polymerase